MGDRQQTERAAIKVIESLAPRLGPRLVTSAEICQAHARDVSHHRPHPPDAVAFPESTDDVAAVVRACAALRVPVIPFGTGTAVEGGVLAVRGGICLDLSRMNHILRLSESDLDVTVEAGVTRGQLNGYLAERQTQLHFPVDPGADASLGGMAATCASGSAAVGYGTMRENVAGLQVVLASGHVMETGGRARKSSAGYDLTRLFVGSEGTLGVITQVTLRLARLPQAVSAAVCQFAQIDAAVDAAIAVLSAGIPLARIELLDEVQMDAVIRYSNLAYAAEPTLFFEFHGSPAAVAEQSQAAAKLVQAHGGGGWQWATEKQHRDRLWQARYDAYYATLALRPGGVGYVTDVCVPRSCLAECIRRTKQEIAGTKLPAPLFGHVGDGNFHVVFVLDPNSESELAEAQRHGHRIAEIALGLGGTCTGEHGIGLGKIDLLEREHATAVPVMRAIKQALDPDGIMNPGKVLRMPG